jgi:hypothetical protein
MSKKYWSAYKDGARGWVLTFHSPAWWERSTSSGHTKIEIEAFVKGSEYPIVWK